MKLLTSLTSYVVLQLQLLQWLVLGADSNQAQFTLLTQFKCDGVAVCAVSQPSKSISVVSKAQCVLYCQRQRQQPESCVGVNYQEQSNTCDVYYYEVTNFAKNVNGCQYIQKGSVDNMKCVSSYACLIKNGGCDTNAVCTDLLGSHTCSCLAGFTGNGVECNGRVECNDNNECLTNNGGCSINAVCINSPGNFTCACADGYTGNGVICSDINECLTNNGDCGTNAICTNTPGRFTCACVTGYAGNGFNCSDINECLTNNDYCDTNAICTNTPGSFTCACVDGYVGNGVNCSDINECLTNNGGCGTNAVCTNTPGSVTCACVTGYTGNGVNCYDIDECLTNNGGCITNAVCANSPGNFTCACEAGYTGNGVICSDINECLTNNGDCSTNAVCTNTPGSFTCACVTGYAGNGFNCSDINECLTNNDDCGPNAICTNTPGSFTCACVTGYAGNGVNCYDIDECLTNNGGCSTNAVCNNTPGSVTCACAAGYTGNGVLCSDINECLVNNGGCSTNAVCTNTPGSFTCACVTGYIGNGVICSVAPGDCTDIMNSGSTTNGLYTVYIGINKRPLTVYCDMTTTTGGWTVFQRRQDGSVNFYKNWATYAAGFGDPIGEFWIGNDNLNALTTAKRYRLRVDLTDFNGNTAYAEYDNFVVQSSAYYYKLSSLGTYTGNAGDSLSVTHLNRMFSTYDADNDASIFNCAVACYGAWWYADCFDSNLNGRFYGGQTWMTLNEDGVAWWYWKRNFYSLKSTMKIKPFG